MIKRPANWIVKLVDWYFRLQGAVLLLCLAAIVILVLEESLTFLASFLYICMGLAYAVTAGIIWKVVYHLQNIDEKMLSLSASAEDNVNMEEVQTDGGTAVVDEKIAGSEESKSPRPSWLDR